MINRSSFKKIGNTDISVYFDDTTIPCERHTLLVCNCGEKEFFYIREANALIEKYFTLHKDVVMIKISVKPELKNYVPLYEIDDIIKQIREHTDELGIGEDFIVLYCSHLGDNFVVYEK